MATQTSEVQPFPPLPPPQPPRFAPVVDQPAGPQERDITPNFIAMAKAVATICGTRVLLLLAVLFSGVGLVWTIYDPIQMRVIAATAYAVVVLWPLVVLYWRKG